MALPVKKELLSEKARFTFADCLAWDENDRIEIISGEAIMMASPSRMHQKISGEIFRQLANYLEGKKCEVYSAPFAVRLFEQETDLPEDADTVVEPDISVICDSGKLDRYGCKGAPDMIIEVLSPSSLRHDRLVKLNLYQRAGVREYWIVDPENRAVQVFLQDASGSLRIYEEYGQGEIAKVNVFEGCFVELGKVFAE